MNFLSNSGSIIGLFALILLVKFIQLSCNSIAVTNHDMPFWRKIGILTYKTTAKQ